jgi:hypothetical protein
MPRSHVALGSRGDDTRDKKPMGAGGLRSVGHRGTGDNALGEIGSQWQNQAQGPKARPVQARSLLPVARCPFCATAARDSDGPAQSTRGTCPQLGRGSALGVNSNFHCVGRQISILTSLLALRSGLDSVHCAADLTP